MSMYQYMFNSCRIPAEGSDYTKVFNNKANNFIIILHNNHYWQLETRKQDTGAPLTYDELQTQLAHIIKASASKELAVGVLTSQHRDTWLKSYSNLLNDSNNEDILEAIESADLVLALDNSKPITRSEVTTKINKMIERDYNCFIYRQ